MLKKIFTMSVLIVSLYATKYSDYNEFQELCQDVRVSSSVSVSKYKSFEDSLNVAKMDALQNLAEEFTGVLVNSSFIQERYKNKSHYKSEIKTYLKTQTQGWIFPKYMYIYNNKTTYYKYNKKLDLLTVSAKLRCNKRIFRELNNKLDSMKLDK